MGYEIRLVALNVNHRTTHKPLPTKLTNSLLQLKPDVLILTEFVEATPRTELREQLSGAGLEYIETSQRIEYSPNRFTNQVLIASHWPIIRVDMLEKSPDPHAEANLLVISTNLLTVAGIRAPSYPKETARNWRRYWEWVSDNLHADVAAGDFNFDPEKIGSKHQTPVKLLTNAGWSFESPRGEWSYQGHGGATTRIDHVITNSGTQVVDAHYIHAGIVPNFSDHSALSALIRFEKSN